MSSNRGDVRISVTLPSGEYRVFASAVRLVSRIMGAQAPDVTAIIRAQFGGRSPVGIADSHLDSAGWPLEEAKEMERTV